MGFGRGALLWLLGVPLPIIILIALLAGFVVFFPWQRGQPQREPSGADVKLGEYLIQAGNCYTCHTAHGGKPYAGGRAIATPYGTLYSSNITPDPQTGLGTWTADDFWRALHEGKSKDGSLLYVGVSMLGPP